MDGHKTDDLIKSFGRAETRWTSTDDKHVDGSVKSQDWLEEGQVAGNGLQVRHLGSDVGRISKLQSRKENETVEAIGRQLLDKQVQPGLWQLHCDSKCRCASPKLFGQPSLARVLG